MNADFELLMDETGGLWIEVHGSDGARFVDAVDLEAFGEPLAREDFEADHDPLHPIGRVA